jgi:hypothetical protein
MRVWIVVHGRLGDGIEDSRRLEWFEEADAKTVRDEVLHYIAE